MTPLLEVRGLHKAYPDGWMLSDVNFTVEEREIYGLLGPSGCGKTTLLRLIAGLEMPDAGQILVHGQDVTGKAPHRRGFGLMFQEYALFPHKDVTGNVAFGLRMAGMEPSVVSSRVAETLELVGLAGFGRRDVSQLSGGERQRIALARSLAPEPRLLMLDEPLGALDRTLRERLMDELPEILHEAGVTVITVTHDQEEAFAISDRVAVMRSGEIVQTGSPQELYRQPKSSWVARFLGLANLVDATVVGEDLVATPLGTLRVDRTAVRERGNTSGVQLLIRPEAALLERSGPNQISLEVISCSFRGMHWQLDAQHASGEVLTFTFSAVVDLPATGETLHLSLDPQALTLLDDGSST